MFRAFPALLCAEATDHCVKLMWTGGTQTSPGDTGVATSEMFEVQANSMGDFDAIKSTRTVYSGGLKSFEFRDNNLSTPRRLAFRVRAKIAGQEWSEWSAPRSVLFSRATISRPPAPGTLHFVDGKEQDITVAWKKPTLAGGAVSSYLLYADGTLIGEVPPDVLEFKWRGVPNFERDGEGHCYRMSVAAVNSQGEGPDSNTLYVQRTPGGVYAEAAAPP